MRSRILATLLAFGSMAMLASCDLGESLKEAFAVSSVDFSSADSAYSGPTVGGPSLAESAYALSFGGKTRTEVLGTYSLKLVFKVNADNSKNKQKASFGQTVRPVLRLRMNSKDDASPIESTMEPFSVDAGKVGALEFPVSIPLTKIDRTTLKKILNGDDIPYFLSGTLNFDLMDGLELKGSGKSEVDLATGAIPTRPSGNLDLAGIASSFL